ncbi:MAG: flavodoxin family protein [Phycisphaerae bacterium]
MEVVAFNGSPRKGGNTSQLIDVVLEELTTAGVQTQRVDICQGRPRGCIGCWKCAENQDEKCVLTDDPVNEWIQLAKNADGLLFGSPTYFANVSAEMKALLDRMGVVSKVNGDLLARKPVAAVAAVRRGGAVPTFDAMNHMFQINRMIVVGSTYWNFGVGREIGEVQNDEEGIANMRDLGQSMAWLLEKLNA